MKIFIIYILNIIRFIKKEFKSKIKTGVFRRLNSLMNGFLSESWIIYDLKNNNKKTYISDYLRFVKTPMIDVQYGYLLDNKLLFERYFAGYCRLIRSEGMVFKDILYSSAGKEDVVPIVRVLLNEGHDIVIKPLKGGGGGGILFISSSNDRYYINGTETKPEEVINQFKSETGALLYKRFKQEGFSSRFFTDSLNTLRVVSMVDPLSGKPFIPIAIHRFGTKRSGFADNWSVGGISSLIELESGRMGKAVSYPYSGKLVWHEKHPDTQVQIEGIIIPMWKEIKEHIVNLALLVPFIPYIGWDVVISGNEIYILEANTNSDVNLLQVHMPMLKIAGVKEFLNHHKVI